MDPRDRLDIGNQKKLNELVAMTTKYASIYRNSKNAHIAQLWLAILEVYKNQEKIQESVRKLEQSLREKKEPVQKDEKEDLKSILEDLKNY